MIGSMVLIENGERLIRQFFSLEEGQGKRYLKN